MRARADLLPAILWICCGMLPCRPASACGGDRPAVGSKVTVVVTFQHARYGLALRIVTKSAELRRIPKERGETFADDVPEGLVSIDVDETSCGFGPYLLKTTPEEARKIVAARSEGRLSLMQESAPSNGDQLPDSRASVQPAREPKSYYTVGGQRFEMRADGVVQKAPLPPSNIPSS